MSILYTYQVYKYKMTIWETAPMQYKDLTLYAILLYHQQVSNAQSDLKSDWKVFA